MFAQLADQHADRPAVAGDVVQGNQQQELFRVDETRTLEFIEDGMMAARINGKIRHLSKIRGKKGTEYICGVKFDLVTRAVAAKVESIVATVQRAHLKELSDKSVANGFDLIA